VILYWRKITVENTIDAMDNGTRVVRKGESVRLRREITGSFGEQR